MDSKKLAKLLTHNHITLEEMSQKTRLPYPYLHQVVKGKKDLSRLSIKKILTYLDIPEDLIEEKDWEDFLNAKIGDKLRALRQEKDLSLEQLGTLTGLSATYLSELETKKTLPSIRLVKELAAFYNVPTSLFFTNIHSRHLVGEKLKRIREYKKMTQRELADKSGLSPSLISQLENGKVHASLETIARLRKTLGVSVCFLILGEEELEQIIAAMNPSLIELLLKPEVQGIIGSICFMDEEKVKLIFNFIEMLNNPKL